MIHTQAQDRNSIDLGDVKARYEEDMSTGDYWIRFYQWKVGATTGVGTPAFAAAHFEVGALTPEELMASLLADDDEIMASLLQDPMEELVASVCPVDVHLIGAPEIPQTADELTASGAIIAPAQRSTSPRPTTRRRSSSLPTVACTATSPCGRPAMRASPRSA